MRLDVDDEPATLQALDEIVLPERPGPGQRYRMKLGDQAAQLIHASGVCQRPPLDVIVEIELFFVDPYRVVDVQRCRLHATPVRGEEIKPSRGMVTEGLKHNVQ